MTFKEKKIGTSILKREGINKLLSVLNLHKLLDT